jgi:hypothetical protein
MMLIGIVWLTGVFALTLMAYIGGIVYNYFLAFFASMNIAPVLQSGAGQMFWFLPLYYTVILVSGIVLTYRCYQETIVVTDYFPDQGYY